MLMSDFLSTAFKVKNRSKESYVAKKAAERSSKDKRTP